MIHGPAVKCNPESLSRTTSVLGSSSVYDLFLNDLLFLYGLLRRLAGDVQALLKDIKQAVGAGGVLRENDVEVQGEHVPRIETMLAKKGCLKGVSSQNIQAAQPQKKQDKPSSKSIAKLDQKAQALKQKK